MRVEWYFWNEPSKSFSNKPVFCCKSDWKPPEGHPNLEVFLSQIEDELFKMVEMPLGYSNPFKEECDTVRTLVMII